MIPKRDIDKAMVVLNDTEKLHGKLPRPMIRNALKQAGCINLLSEEEK